LFKKTNIREIRLFVLFVIYDGEDVMIEIRGQQATDWQDVYEMRTSIPGALPYIRPDWVRDELAKPQDRAWPVVAVLQTQPGPKVVARMNVQLGWARRAHCAYLSFEQHPDYAGLPGRQLLQETIRLAEGWWNSRRLQVTVPATDPDIITLFETFGFAREARLRQGIRIAGELVDEVVLRRRGTTPGTGCAAACSLPRS